MSGDGGKFLNDFLCLMEELLEGDVDKLTLAYPSLLYDESWDEVPRYDHNYTFGELLEAVLEEQTGRKPSWAKTEKKTLWGPNAVQTELCYREDDKAGYIKGIIPRDIPQGRYVIETMDDGCYRAIDLHGQVPSIAWSELDDAQQQINAWILKDWEKRLEGSSCKCGGKVTIHGRSVFCTRCGPPKGEVSYASAGYSNERLRAFLKRQGYDWPERTDEELEEMAFTLLARLNDQDWESVMPQIPEPTEDQKRKAVEEGLQAFWAEIVSNHFPEAESGDYPFDADISMHEEMAKHLDLWLKYNHPALNKEEAHE